MADKIIYAISTTGSTIILVDLNKQRILSSETDFLSDLYPLYIIQEVASLKTYILNGQITINNGTSNLSIVDAIIYIYGGTTSNSNISNCISYMFSAGAHNGWEITGSTYGICTKFRYLGTILQGSPVSITFLIETSNNSSYLQLWDITNNKQIMLSTLTNTNSIAATHVVTTFTNLPANAAIFELRDKATSGTHKLYAMDIQF